MLFYKSLCHRRATLRSDAGPLAKRLADVLEMLRAGCQKDTHEWAGCNSRATNAIAIRRISQIDAAPLLSPLPPRGRRVAATALRGSASITLGSRRDKCSPRRGSDLQMVTSCVIQKVFRT